MPLLARYLRTLIISQLTQSLNNLHFFTYALIEEYLRIDNFNDSYDIKIIANSFGLEPYASLVYTFNKIVFRLNLGYNLLSDGALHHEDYEDAYLLDSNGNKVKVEWNGFRIGLSIGYNFFSD